MNLVYNSLFNAVLHILEPYISINKIGTKYANKANETNQQSVIIEVTP